MSILLPDLYIESHFIETIYDSNDSYLKLGGVFIFKNGVRIGFESNFVIDFLQNVCTNGNNQFVFSLTNIPADNLNPYPLLS